MVITRTTSRADAWRVGRSGRGAALAWPSRFRSRTFACVRAGVLLTLATAAATAGAQVGPQTSYPGMPSTASPGSALGNYPGMPGTTGGPDEGARRLSTGSGQFWLIEPTVDTLFTLTDNVNLTPTDRKADFVTQLVPGVKFSEQSAHSRLQGTVQAPILLYARTGGENNEIVPQVAVSGIAELVERLFYVDAAINVSQQYLSPFGARPADFSTATNNRYTAQSYRVSPLFKGDAGYGLSYEVRDDNTWADEGNTAFATERSYTNELSGQVTREARPVGWKLEYDHTDTTFVDQPSLRSQIARAHVIARPDPAFEWSLVGGYEDNNYPGVTNESGAVYGAGVKWRPTDRTTVDANYEHRFFGASYHADIEHRTPLSVWSITASRDITTYPQQLAALGGGQDVNALLNQLFSSRITDPLQRQQFVDQFIRERGLPATVAGPVALYSQQVLLEQAFNARAGLIGARNALVGTLFRLRTEPVGQSGAFLPDQLLAQDNNTQTGGSLTWTFKVTSLYTLSTSATYDRTVENVADGQHTRNLILVTSLGAELSPLTRGLVGVRWQRLWSNFGNDYREAAMFVGLTHIFR